MTNEEWGASIPVTGFQQYDPVEGAEATELTSVRVVYDDNAVYFGVMCFDSDPRGIVSQLARRDRSTQADKFTVIIDSYHDHSTGFLFSGTVSGMQSDGILSNDGLAYDIQWDAVWEFNAQIVEDGWSAEFKIPYGALRFAEQDSEYIWGINFRRSVARKKETDEWVLVARKDAPPGTISSVSKMGHLSGIRDIHPALHLEVLPYQVSKMSYLSQPSPFSLQKDFSGTLGLDLKYGVTNNFTLDLAVNPDFGQVEVDQAVLNLTVFKTFYPEKRPFFLEGSQMFSFGNAFDGRQLLLFYSRQIGRRPIGPSPDPGNIFIDKPSTTRILGAGKLTGKTDGGLSIGVLSVLTRREEGIEEDTNGTRKPAILFEPRASYNVLRLKQDVLENSYVGIVATGAGHDGSFPSFSGGVDWNLRFDQSAYAVDGYLAGSMTTPSIDNRRTGSSGRIAIGRLQDPHLLAFSLYDFTTNNFRIDDLGFFSQPREHGGYTQVTYKDDRLNAIVRRYAISLQTDYRWNWDGVNTVNQIEVEPSVEFDNFWFLTLDYVWEFPAHDDANRGVVGLYRHPAKNNFSATLQTDSRRPVMLSMRTGYTNSTKGLNSIFSSVQFTLRPITWMEFSPAFTLIRSRNEETWVFPVYTANGYNLFGDRDLDQYDFSLRGTITFTRDLSVQFFTQVFLPKGHYSNFKELISHDNLPLYDYVNTTSYVNPDFNQQIVNANFVLRWEYLPGSTFYFVWTHARTGDNGLFGRSLSENFSEAFRLPSDNVFLAKISYWWSL